MSIYWHLAMQYHVDPYPGHATGKARDCWECKQIAALIERVGRDVNP